MEFLQSVNLILSITIVFPVLLLQKNSVYARPTGLTMRLTHMDASESPMYPGYLTREEGIRRDFRRSKARHQQITASDIAKPPVSFSAETHFYMALVGLGTFPNRTFINYYLIVDSASDLLWVQCQGCDPCYPQVGDAYYPASSSATYSPLPCHNPDLCAIGKCDGTSCSYQVDYADGSNTYGILASETLTVNADNDGLDAIDNFVFGCGYKQKDFKYGHGNQTKTELGGILGLGGGEMSFLRQLGDRGQMKFAYCFQLWTHSRASSTYLRFGSDANIGGGGQVAVYTTPMFFARGDTVYYVNLHDISIAGVPVGYPPEDLGLNRDGTGGCVFDSGTPFTMLSPLTYIRLADHLIQYFATLNVYTTDHGVLDEHDTCFTKPNGFNAYPTITFHFAGAADLEVQPEAAFYITDHIFCLAIFRPDGEAQPGPAVIIGAVQQANHKVLYDVGNRQISWAREECV